MKLQSYTTLPQSPVKENDRFVKLKGQSPLPKHFKRPTVEKNSTKNFQITYQRTISRIVRVDELSLRGVL